ncbi:DMT family transporter [Mycolicibacterium iranicum]|uniref:Ligand-binding protein SH3 n=1 Tax=Mycolicibacterium iranicum TaxID=912594 RepID=A0A1X1WSU3_MYCIR|nr:multidrug efflux SMR transporter [Mycolicibacterium iranicum]ORV89579.1 ligand-binding protein SH3 [Mycolicibacterium iranicum]
MAWLVLVLSGFLEAVWATALGMSDHFKRWRPTLAFALAMPASLAGLAYSMTSLPAGTAYAVWVGIGATLTVVWAIVTKKEAASTARVLLLCLLVGSVVGLKAVS